MTTCFIIPYIYYGIGLLFYIILVGYLFCGCYNAYVLSAHIAIEERYHEIRYTNSIIIILTLWCFFGPYWVHWFYETEERVQFSFATILFLMA